MYKNNRIARRLLASLLYPMTSVFTGEGAVAPKTVSKADSLITLDIDPISLRDPFILHYGGKYYVYATKWLVAESECDDITSRFSTPVRCVETPEDFEDNDWAPEVHEYNGRLYMITTYRSSETWHRGCAIFASESPTGPFKLISDGHVTPKAWDAIDGTLYIDGDGQPWMVFVHEWTSTDDGIGRMACAKLSNDLTHLVSEPIELFRADDPSWTNHQVTDGCYLYRTKSGKLLMIWSNWDSSGYAVGLAESESGSVTGPWIQCDRLLYSKSFTGKYDGGHGMLFTDNKGRLWMLIHSPNGGIEAGRVETPVLVPLKEENNTLVWDVDYRKTH